ncbi:transport ATP-binding protein CydC [Salmonella enterica subsp. enterica]|uniref:Transport ATP-binding protein CydC n=1 Tax=Salmonella enterica I TaxID=59201 RepID=A0A447U647_SALET|nr:transport ATP-binding protein CydC [Salmonella enterica subsp. enterica]
MRPPRAEMLELLADVMREKTVLMVTHRFARPGPF